MTDLLPRVTESPIETISSEIAFETPWMRVRRDQIRRQDGSTGWFGYMESPHDIVMVAPLTDDRRICLVRQWRYPWRRDSWELPAGRCEAGETALDGARRELKEETGVSARDWRHLVTFYGSASIATPFHFYMATGLEVTATAHDHEEQDMIVAWVPLEDGVKAVMDGRIVHSASIGGILRLDRLAAAGEI